MKKVVIITGSSCANVNVDGIVEILRKILEEAVNPLHSSMEEEIQH